MTTLCHAPCHQAPREHLVHALPQPLPERIALQEHTQPAHVEGTVAEAVLCLLRRERALAQSMDLERALDPHAIVGMDALRAGGVARTQLRIQVLQPGAGSSARISGCASRPSIRPPANARAHRPVPPHRITGLPRPQISLATLRA